MAEVKPFKGYRYNREVIDDLAQVVAPPYDVISPPYQQQLYDRHPNNIIRLILGQQKSDDDISDNVYTRAEAYLHQWRSEHILKQDAKASFYLTAVDFTIEERPASRFGLLAVVGIRPFTDGVILPHEHTFSKVKSERLRLMKATHANLCPIFGLFADKDGELALLQRSLADKHAPDVDLVDDDGYRHRLWCIDDAATVERISSFFDQRKIYIADGHHRYETALNYREWLKSASSDFSGEHPANYILMSLSSMQDPGMVILPAHRLLKQVGEEALLQLTEAAQNYFHIVSIDDTCGIDEKVAQVRKAMTRYAEQHAIGVISRNPEQFRVFVLKEGVMDSLFSQDIAEPLRDLDVTVLTHLILMKLLGLDQSALDDVDRIVYKVSARESADMVLAGQADAAFVLNPTQMEQVQHVSEVGLTMPRKSTYFFPKVLSGHVFHIFE